MSKNKIVGVVALVGASGLGASVALGSITIPTLRIVNPGNAADPLTGFGSVGYVYRIGSTEVTNAQYAAFLNAVATTDTYDLYSTSMAGTFGGITRSGGPGSYSYATISGRANHPVNFVSFWDAVRFANWLHNGQPTGAQDPSTTEDGAYTLTPAGITANTVTRNAGWQWAVTSEDEWYKAAYHQPSSRGGPASNYWLYPTSSNSVPTGSQANFASSNINDTVPVGTYPANYSGTFDMGGNVFEWNESRLVIVNRGLRGGAVDTSPDVLRADNRTFFGDPSAVGTFVGFRVVQLPAPCPADIAGTNQATIPDGELTADDIIVFLAWYFANDLRANVAGPNQSTVPDGELTADDIIVFLGAYFAGC
jgi:formylglycine-generating enzyme